MAIAAPIAAPIAAAASIASIGLSAAGTVAQGQAAKTQSEGVNAADQMQAQQAEEAAQFAQLQAVQSDTNYRQKLNTTLANINAIQSSQQVDITSPTTTAIENWDTQLSDTQRIAQDVTLRSQAATDIAGANYLNQAGQFSLAQGQTALDTSYLSAAAGVAGGLAKGFSPGGAFSSKPA